MMRGRRYGINNARVFIKKVEWHDCDYKKIYALEKLYTYIA